MAFISSKFNMPSLAGSGLNEQGWCDLFLTNIKNAFVAANNAWSQVGTIETIGTYTGTSIGLRTIQLYSSASQKYVRIWCFCGNLVCYYVDSATTSGGTSNIYLYKGNIMRINQTEGAFLGGDYPEVFFAVADNSIDSDFAKDLALSVPIFCLRNKYTNGTSQWISSDSNTTTILRYGATISVITDGSFFGVIRILNAYSYINACFYAPDMIVCANSGDLNTEGVITSQDEVDNFYFGDNNPYSAEEYVKVLFNAADGTHDFRGWTEGIYNGKDSCMNSENAADMPCTALKIFLNINTYSGSTLEWIIDGISLKGWVNPKYMRSASVTVLPSSYKNMTFDHGDWLCTAAGTLICWNALNTSPFEVAV